MDPQEKPMAVNLDDTLKNLQNNGDTIDKLIHENAKYMRISYQALVAEGFTDLQALELIKIRGFLA